MIMIIPSVSGGSIPKKRALLYALLAILIEVAAGIVAEDETFAWTKRQQQYKSNRDLAATSSRTYIVTFADKSISPADQCEALAISTGGTVMHVYDAVLNGCALKVPVAQVQAQTTLTDM